jgi:hypothetical protein
MGKDLVVGGATIRDGADGFTERDEADGKRIGQCAVQIEEHSFKLHA